MAWKEFVDVIILLKDRNQRKFALGSVPILSVSVSVSGSVN